MLKTLRIFGFLLMLSIFGSTLFAQTWYDSTEIRIEQIRKGNFGFGIKDELGNAFTDSVKVELINHEFAWGGVIPEKETPNYKWVRAIVAKYYNTGVTGNIFKWPYVEPTQNNPTYTVQDEILDWAEKNDLRFRGHCLIWGGDEGWQMPSWTLGGSLTPEEIYTACEAHITRDVTYWKGRVHEYDVVNEPSEGHETWLSETVGDSVNWKSFEWAHAADPDAVLYANEYNVVVWGQAPAYHAFIESLLANGAPIHGIGAQGHMEGNIDWRDVKEKLDFMADLGLPIRITEFDMKIDEFGVSDESMAASYARMMKTVFSHPAVNGMVFWSNWDGDAWRAGSGLYDEYRIPKLAADSVFHLIHEKWTTDLEFAAGEGTEQYSYRGFYGDYRITAEFNGELREFVIPATAVNADSVFILEYAGSKPANAHLLGISVSKNADGIEMVFDQEMDIATFAPADFSLYSDNDYPLAGFTLIDPYTLKIAPAGLNYQPRQFYGIYYDGDIAASINGNLLEKFGPDKAANDLPAFLSAQSDTLGETITVTFSKPMETSISVADFVITVSGSAASVSGAASDNADSSIVVFTLAEPLIYSDAIRISYNGEAFYSADGYKLVNFGLKYVENRVPTPAPDISNSYQSSISVYPNPLKDELNFENVQELQEILIYDTQGRLLDKVQILARPKFTLNTAGYPSGLLLVRIVDRNDVTCLTYQLIKE